MSRLEQYVNEQESNMGIGVEVSFSWLDNGWNNSSWIDHGWNNSSWIDHGWNNSSWTDNGWENS